MDPLVLLLIIVALVLVVGGGAALYLRGRSTAVLPPAEAPVEAPPLEEAVVVDEPLVEDVEAPPSFRDRLGKARSTMAGYISSVISRGAVNAETWEELEEALVRADVGVGTTMELLEAVRTRAETDGITDGEHLIELVKDEHD